MALILNSRLVLRGTVTIKKKPVHGKKKTALFSSRVAFWRLSTLGWVEMNAPVPPLGLLRSLYELLALAASSGMLLLDYKSWTGCFQHGGCCRALLSRVRLLQTLVFLPPPPPPPTPHLVPSCLTPPAPLPPPAHPFSCFLFSLREALGKEDMGFWVTALAEPGGGCCID